MKSNYSISLGGDPLSEGEYPSTFQGGTLFPVPGYHRSRHWPELLVGPEPEKPDLTARMRQGQAAPSLVRSSGINLQTAIETIPEWLLDREVELLLQSMELSTRSSWFDRH